MRTSSRQPERRIHPRFDGREMRATVRQRGRIARSESTVVDFNRFGIALLTRRRLPKNKPIFLNLECHGIRLDNVVGVVHNCIDQAGEYRCGIQFRTRSELQLDQRQVEEALLRLELELIATPLAGIDLASAAQ
jgi:hypothetical protein